MKENERKWRKMKENERKCKENERKWKKMEENERKWKKMKENEKKWKKMKKENEEKWKIEKRRKMEKNDEKRKKNEKNEKFTRKILERISRKFTVVVVTFFENQRSSNDFHERKVSTRMCLFPEGKSTTRKWGENESFSEEKWHIFIWNVKQKWHILPMENQRKKNR